MLWLIIWKVSIHCCKDFSPLTVFFPMIMYGIYINLLTYDALPEFLYEKDVWQTLERICLVWIIIFFANFTSFRSTIVMIGPVATILYINYASHVD